MDVKLCINFSGPKYVVDIFEQGAEENTVFERVLFARVYNRT
jgi:hypothetical protein